MYNCLDCGACCRVFGVVEINQNDDVPSELRVQTELGYERMVTVDFVCVCLCLNNQCSIYDKRPAVCRLFQVGGNLCEMARRQQQKIKC